MAYEHLASLKTKINTVSALTIGAGNFISASIANNGSSKLKKDIGDDEYLAYMTYMLAEKYNSAKLIHQLTNEDIKMNTYFTAEAYAVLYFLSIGLKKVDKDTVLLDGEMFGSGKVDMSLMDNLIAFKEEFLKLYREQLSSVTVIPSEEGTYLASSGIFIGVI